MVQSLPGLTFLPLLLSVEVGQGRLGPAVPTQRVAVLGHDVGGLRGAGRQVVVVIAATAAAAATAAPTAHHPALAGVHGLHPVPDPRQEGVAEELAQQGIVGKVVQELGEVLREGK